MLTVPRYLWQKEALNLRDSKRGYFAEHERIRLSETGHLACILPEKIVQSPSVH